MKFSKNFNPDSSYKRDNETYALIVAAGDVSEKYFDQFYAGADYIVCADGGAVIFRKQKCKADLFLGDCDSILKEDLDYILEHSDEKRFFPSAKDKTDTELALDAVHEKGYNRVYLLGATGSRLDHTLSNLYLLYQYEKKGLKIILVTELHEIFYVQDHLVVETNKKYFSLVPIFVSGAKVSALKSKYPLNNTELPFGKSLALAMK